MLLKRRPIVWAICTAALLTFVNGFADLMSAIEEATGQTVPPQTGPAGYQSPMILILLSAMLPMHVPAITPPPNRAAKLLWATIILASANLIAFVAWTKRYDAAITFILDLVTFVLLLLLLKTVPKTDLICTPAPPEPAPETTAEPA